MNIITLTGNATKDLEIRYSQMGTAFANGTIAVRRSRKDQNNEYLTDFHDFVAIGKTAEIMANHIKKGHKFGITGELQNRSWEQDGQKRYKTEIIVSGFDFPYESRKNQDDTNNQPPQQNSSIGQNSGYKPMDDPFANPFEKQGTIDISSDDLPF